MAILAYNLRVAGGLSVGLNVLRSLRNVADQHEYLLLLPAGVGYETCKKPTRTKTHYYTNRSGALGRVVYDLVEVPARVKNFRPDYIWALGNFGLENPPCPQAILFHQAYLLYDATEQESGVWRLTPDLRYVRWRLRRSLKATSIVFCQTDVAEERFRRIFAFPGQCAVMPNAISTEIQDASEHRVPEIMNKINDKFPLLCLTRYYPHKNIDILAKMFEASADDLRDVAIVFTVSRTDGPGSAGFCARISHPILRQNLVNAGPLPQQQLPNYFANVGALILPTLLESFTGTYIEAMKMNCPILTSDRDFARTICADAAIYFDPMEPEDIKRAILQLKSDKHLADCLRMRGAERLSAISRTWDSIVEDALRKIRESAPT